MLRLKIPEKLVQRTAQARRNCGRKDKKLQKYAVAQARTERFREQRGYLDELNEDVQVARIARREKWEQGPLAPRRDFLDSWGAIESNRQKRQSPLNRDEAERRCAWAGGAKYLNLVVKDRVVVLEGPDKGRIDRIDSIDKENGTVTLENICKVRR